jgi:hypothetical protein
LTDFINGRGAGVAAMARDPQIALTWLQTSLIYANERSLVG